MTSLETQKLGPSGFSWFQMEDQPEAAAIPGEDLGKCIAHVRGYRSSARRSFRCLHLSQLRIAWTRSGFPVWFLRSFSPGANCVLKHSKHQLFTHPVFQLGSGATRMFVSSFTAGGWSEEGPLGDRGGVRNTD